jgi:hypothetical protein
MRQCKTLSAGNGQALSKDRNAAVAHWGDSRIGQGDKRSSAVLHSFALATGSPALVRLASERLSSCCTRQFQVDGVLELHLDRCQF